MSGKKVLGSALLFIIAMGVMTSQAWATNRYFHSESTSTTLSGVQTATTEVATDSGTLQCAGGTASGTESGETVQEITIAYSPSGCKMTGFIEANATVDANGCHYTIKAHRTVTDLNPHQLTTKNASVRLHMCNMGTAGVVITAPFCTITITSEQEFEGVNFSNSGAGTTREFTAETTATGVLYKESGFACKNSSGSTTGGTYKGSIRMTGTSGGSHVGVLYE